MILCIIVICQLFNTIVYSIVFFFRSYDLACDFYLCTYRNVYRETERERGFINMIARERKVK